MVAVPFPLLRRNPRTLRLPLYLTRLPFQIINDDLLIPHTTTINELILMIQRPCSHLVTRDMEAYRHWDMGEEECHRPTRLHSKLPHTMDMGQCHAHHRLMDHRLHSRIIEICHHFLL